MWHIVVKRHFYGNNGSTRLLVHPMSRELYASESYAYAREHVKWLDERPYELAYRESGRPTYTLCSDNSRLYRRLIRFV